MKNFNLEAPNATLENLNHRTEIQGEDIFSAFDLKITCEASAEMAGYLLGMQDHKPDFWDGNEIADVKYYGLDGDIASKAEFKDCTVTFKDVKVIEAKVNKFKFHPITGNKIALTMRVQFRPDDEQIVEFSHLQRQSGGLVIEADKHFEPGIGVQTTI